MTFIKFKVMSINQHKSKSFNAWKVNTKANFPSKQKKEEEKREKSKIQTKLLMRAQREAVGAVAMAEHSRKHANHQ